MSDVLIRFAKEIRTLEERRAGLVEAGGEGKWVAVRGDVLLGPYPDCDRAWCAGIEAFGKPGFFVKQVWRVERPIIVSYVDFEALRTAARPT